MSRFGAQGKVVSVEVYQSLLVNTLKQIVLTYQIITLSKARVIEKVSGLKVTMP
jgi:hypothetical protein